jgi:hypothetical protein
MKCRILFVAAVFMCGAVAPAGAKEKRAAASSLRAIQIECLKQYGAYEDPQTKQLKMVGGPLAEFQARTDAIYACIAQKTGKPATPFIRSEVTFR